MATFSNNLGAKKGKKGQQDYICIFCDFKCCKKYSWERHLLTAKHIKATINNNLATKTGKKGQIYDCEYCNKQYSDRTGLWRHKKTCTSANQNKDESMNDKELIQFLLKESSEFKHFMMEQNKQIIELANKAGNNNSNNNNTTNNNQQFNLNFYLNETCKNAMNIMDFVSQLQVGIKDLEETGRLGYAEGISKIFINGLKQMNVTDRPIHCSDFKRETLYIKDNDQWNKETEHKVILTNAIKHVAHKNMKNISEWTKIHPDYKDSESKENDRYLKIVSESMSGCTEQETNKNYSKIIKNIVKETVIDKVNDTTV